MEETHAKIIPFQTMKSGRSMINDWDEKSILTMSAMQKKRHISMEKREQFHEVKIFAEGMWLQQEK